MQKKKSGVKKCLEILPLKGGVGPLVANAILNFHFDFLHTSLRPKAGSVTMAAELNQRDISWNKKLRENMSPAKEVMMLLVQSMKGPRRQE